MRNVPVLDLADCTEFRQALQARPPRIMHGTAILLSTLLGSALAWSALTKADLVVRGLGRVRPLSTPQKIFSSGRGEVLSASVGGRVVEVNFREGDQVRKGDMLIRLDTERLDNEIAKHRRTIRAAEEELGKLRRMAELLARQFEAGRAKAEAELAQGKEEVGQAKKRQAADVQAAQAEWEAAQDEENRLKKLSAGRAAAETDLVKATCKLRETKAKLEKAQLPVEEGRLEVLRRVLILAEEDFAVKREELDIKRGLKLSELDSARLELASLEFERQQAVLCAPIDGIVVSKDVNVGDVLKAGSVALEIAEQKGFRFEVPVSSEDVAHLRVGMPARIKLDAFDYQKYGTLTGTVAFLAPDSEVREEQKSAAYLVKIDVQGEEVGYGELRGKVKLGMTGQVEIVTDQESLLLLLARKIRQSISLTPGP